MMTLEQIRTALADRRMNAVSEATGLHYNTVRDVIMNTDSNPTYRVVKLLNDYLVGESENGEPK